jgi:hypothetical protein
LLQRLDDGWNFDISKPSALDGDETACRKKFYSVPMVFLKFDGRFYREFEYLCAAIIIQNLIELRHSRLIGIHGEAFGMG